MEHAMCCPCENCQFELRQSVALDTALAAQYGRLALLQALKAQQINSELATVIRFPVERTHARGEL